MPTQSSKPSLSVRQRDVSLTNPIMAENVQEVRKEVRFLCAFRYTRAVDGNYKIMDGNTDEAEILDRFMFKRRIHWEI